MDIKLSPLAERRLSNQARAEGVDLPTLAARVLEAEASRLSADGTPKTNQATIDLLNQWEANEATKDPVELARRQREAEEFIQSINESRAECEGPNARKHFP